MGSPIEAYEQYLQCKSGKCSPSSDSHNDKCKRYKQIPLRAVVDKKGDVWDYNKNLTHAAPAPSGGTAKASSMTKSSKVQWLSYLAKTPEATKNWAYDYSTAGEPPSDAVSPAPSSGKPATGSPMTSSPSQDSQGAWTCPSETFYVVVLCEKGDMSMISQIEGSLRLPLDNARALIFNSLRPFSSSWLKDSTPGQPSEALEPSATGGGTYPPQE